MPYVMTGYGICRAVLGLSQCTLFGVFLSVGTVRGICFGDLGHFAYSTDDFHLSSMGWCDPQLITGDICINVIKQPSKIIGPVANFDMNVVEAGVLILHPSLRDVDVSHRFLSEMVRNIIIK